MPIGQDSASSAAQAELVRKVADMGLPAGWYPVAGDPPGTQRYWDGEAFTTGPKRDVNARRKAGFIKPNSAAKWNMAPPISRLLAAMIDYGAPVAIVLGIANGMGAEVPDTTLDSWLSHTDLVATIIGVILVNQVLLVGFWGVSIGRILLGLRVVDARDRDRAPGLSRALVRFLLAAPGAVFTAAMFLLGKRRGVHDLAAGTAVVYT